MPAGYYFIKLYHEILHDPKMGQLPDRAWRRAIELFLLAGEQDRDGYLPSVPDIAWALRVPENELQEDLDLLASVGIVTQDENNTWFVTKFAERQAPVNAKTRKAQQRERDRKRDYYSHSNHHDNVTETVTDNVTIRDTYVTREDESRVDIDEEVEVEDKRDTSGTAAGAVDAFLQARGGAVNPLDADQISDLVHEFETLRLNLPRGSPGAALSGDDWVREAILVANGARDGRLISLNYVKSILDRWRAQGYKAPFQAKNGGSAEVKVQGL